MNIVKFASAAAMLAASALLCHGAAVPRAEYPRPQFERDNWVNLNGTWDYIFDFSASGSERGLQSAPTFEGKITVPFCPESELSGVGYKDFINCIWYRRDLPVPAEWDGKKILLNFGAVYYNADIFLNGKLIDRHFGGSSSFSVDLTPHVIPGKTHNLVVRATSDLRSGLQSAGKQSLQSASNGCNYTRTTGIWQTVWMEAVDPHALKNVHIITDIDQEQLIIQPQFYSDGTSNTLEITVSENEARKPMATRRIKASSNSVAVLPMKNAKLWSPESPTLYSVSYKLFDSDGKLLDEVKSYVGMRKVHTDGNQVYLNNKPYYQRLVLDQGFYPDGIWTAPSDEALKHDIELSKSVGFNGARLHQKVFEERYYYWADRLGYLTWGEAPSWGMDMNSVEAARNFTAEWKEIVMRDRNHPSIVTWTPMNEQWWPDHIQYPRLTADLYDITKAIDPTRPVNDASGGGHIKTDIWTVHNYEQDPNKLKEIIYNDGKMFSNTIQPVTSHIPGANLGFNAHISPIPFPYPTYDGTIPYIIDEVGGIKWVKDQDKSSRPDSWGYGKAPVSEEEFFTRLEGQINAILELDEQVWGYCYTQLTDVEQEQNGVFYYDRTPKFDASRFNAIFSKNPESLTSSYRNPILGYGPDPWAYYHNGYYYYMHTMVDHLVLWRTKDITDLANAEKKTIWIPTDPSNSFNLWAPEIHNVNGKWYVYYAADDGNSDNHQMYVLENTSKNPFDGEFVMKGRISTDPDNNWAIDGSVFEHNGELYMVWSGWQTRRVDTETQCIYIARMKTPWELGSDRVLISQPQHDWERQYLSASGAPGPAHIVYVNEGPQPLKSPGGKYIHIAYSASGVWTEYYSLGLLTASTDADLLDPASWHKSDKPIFRQSPENGVFGTGHNSFFRSPDGSEYYVMFHARDTQVDPPGKGDTRSPRIQKIEWNDEYPVLGTPAPSYVRHQKPSGTPLASK